MSKEYDTSYGCIIKVAISQGIAHYTDKMDLASLIIAIKKKTELVVNLNFILFIFSIYLCFLEVAENV